MKQVICILLCSAACVLPAVAESNDNDPDPVVSELARVRASLDRLVQLLEDAQAAQQAELLLRRIERRERRLLPLESRLRTAREDLVQLDEELVKFAAYREQLDEEIRAATGRGESSEPEAGLILDRLDAEKTGMERRKEQLELRIRQLEDQVAEQLEEIEFMEGSLEEMVADSSGSD